jgi:hypothetical protein
MQKTIRRLTVVWPLLIFLLLPTLTLAETAVQAWVQRYNGSGNGDDFPYAVAVDRGNNVIVAGESQGDYATIKCSSAGMPLWTNLYNGPANGTDYASAVAVDGSNNVIVTGSSSGSAGYSEYATIKYSSAGVPLWTNLYGGPAKGNDYPVALALDQRQFTKDLGFRGIEQAEALPRLHLGSSLVGSRGGDAERLVQRG